ncbi:MAG: FAD-binding oxidoreductase [Patescibacteria group bacterium]
MKFKILITILFFSIFVASASAQVDYGSSSPKDSDYDGLTDQSETQTYKTDPQKFDTDGDGISDGAEILVGSDPAVKNVFDKIMPQIEKKSAPWVWYAIRTTGLTAYVLMFFAIVFGVGIYTKFIFRILKSETVFVLHKLFSVYTWIFVTIHIFSLFFDKYLGFSLTEIFIPFLSHFKSVPVGLGIISFYGFLAIIISSLFFRLKHRRAWRLLHYLTYPTFLSVLMHGIRTGSDTSAFQGLYWTTGFIFAALVLYRLAYPYIVKEYRAVIKKIEMLAGGVIVLSLALSDDEKLKFKPGQYVSIALYDKRGKIGQKHHFSISSSPDEGGVRLGIKIFGKFTQELSVKKEGDEIALFGPYGDFVFDAEKMKDVVFIAGGIGITPFMSAFRCAADRKLPNKMTLLYSNKTVDGTAFFDEIKALAGQNNNFKPYFTVTNEIAPRGFEHGMLCQATMQKFIANFSNKYFFICGPAPFMEAMAGCLRSCGVPENRIRREFFY